MLGWTTVVYYKGDIVAYYTLSSGSLESDDIPRSRRIADVVELRIKSIPALLIGRLAVDKRYQGRGIGMLLIQKIAMIALSSGDYATRLIIVQAKKDAFHFYEKLGFAYVRESKREMDRFRARGTRTMFFDLKALRDQKTFKNA